MAKVFTITEGLENLGALRTGGQGSVYKARRTGEIITAVKLLPTPIYSESPDDKHFTDFENEVNKLKRVNKNPNPNVVKILSSGITETGSLPFIEMEYIEGPDLEELLQSPNDPIFSIKEVIKVADQLSNALLHCHKADVKHGDIKANNIKFNVHTGNYVLLDFGMAIMTDEQRRTSLRQAGAIEFMAPEQNEGHILKQTDVYSFGIVLFELVSGTVPFPIIDKGETARNNVMLAHMEKEPPDVLALRKNAMPSTWSEERRANEMQVPEWLVNTIYICLQKKPEQRFNDGEALHNYIVLRNTKAIPSITISDEVLQLQQEKHKLIEERDTLLQQLSLFQQRENNNAQRISQTSSEYMPSRKKGAFPFLFFFLLMALTAGGMYWYYNQKDKPAINKSPDPIPTAAAKKTTAQYKVLVARAYFYDQPDVATRRSAYMVPSNDIITSLNEKNGFIYTEFTNSRGKTSKGWLRKSDLLTLDQWNTREPDLNISSSADDVNNQLADARKLMNERKTKQALYIYSYLVEQKVPEAMYEYGNLGLQGRNTNIDCVKAYTLIEEASNSGYIPAKRTLGFLYIFADNQDILEINNYDNCGYKRDVYKGTKLLTESMMAGDTLAKRLIDELNIRQSFQNNDTVE
jgi:serine/threonine-protein kinase